MKHTIELDVKDIQQLIAKEFDVKEEQVVVAIKKVYSGYGIGEHKDYQIYATVKYEVKYTPKNSNKIMIVTTGGEPLLRKDIAECGREITKKGFIWGMVSNGMLLTKEKLDELIKAGLKSIAISLDGFEDEHNWMRGNRQSFKNAVNAIKCLRDTSITWDVITCVNQRNLTSIDNFREFLMSIGVRRWRIFTIFPGSDPLSVQILLASSKSLIPYFSITGLISLILLS